MTLSLAPMTRAFAEEVTLWRYGPPFDVYDGDASALVALLDGNHLAILDDGRFVGYVATGPEARVRGGPTEDDGVTDVGIGLDPRVVSVGLGGRAGALAVEALRLAGHHRLRACILASNVRSMRLAEGLGFCRTGEFVDPEGRTFCVVELGLERDDDGLSGRPTPPSRR